MTDTPWRSQFHPRRSEAAASTADSSPPPNAEPVPPTTTYPIWTPASGVTLYEGDVRTVLGEIERASVDCVVTSPPYYGLRDYGTGEWEGGSATCDHQSAKMKTRYDYSLESSPLQKGRGGGTDARPGLFKQVCPDCGARRIDLQLGLEATVDDYVCTLRDVFADIHGALKSTGTVFLNIGDSYGVDGLYGVPWRVVFALQECGWILRRDIIWSKPNPMPESARNRPTTAHEYVFLLTKTKEYFWDYDAVKEPAEWERWGDQTAGKYEGVGKAGMVKPRTKEELQQNEWRNSRSVWEIATEPSRYAHYAPMPERLAEKCITAGCPVGGTVLDPFAGTGTTLLVADDLERKAIGVELSSDNCQIIERRFKDWSRKRLERRQLTL